MQMTMSVYICVKNKFYPLGTEHNNEHFLREFGVFVNFNFLQGIYNFNNFLFHIILRIDIRLLMQRSWTLLSTLTRSTAVRTHIHFNVRTCLRSVERQQSIHPIRPFISSHKYRAFSHSTITRDAALNGPQYKPATVENGLTISDKAIQVNISTKNLAILVSY